ncbi:MAG: zinc ribbon domain-containing protein [Candidatus Aminicenantia bacterium]
MENKFKQLENEFQKLKEELHSGLIDQEGFRNKLKQLRIKDSKGRYWMIGAQSGKWYYYNGQEWVESEPPIEEVEKEKIICQFCGTENELGSTVCVKCGKSLKEEKRICFRCGSKITNEYIYCPVCGLALEGERKEEKGHSFQFKKLEIGSSFLFSAGIGIILGVVIGAFIGVSDYFYNLVFSLPQFLKEIHGRFLGGLVYGSLGAILGFFLIGLLGLFWALILNFISFIFGGFKVSLVEKK